MSKNAEGWIRHRGGKCPVESGVKVDYRMRNGSIDSFGRKSDTLYWDHDNEGGDIMAYRLHKPAEQVEACSKPELQINLQDGYGEIYNAQAIEHGPLQWRDRIAEIDSTTQDLTTERAELVQKLASEGFALIGRVVEPVEDMSDWRNWQAGDFVEAIDTSGGYSPGCVYEIRGFDLPCGVVYTVSDDSGRKTNGWSNKFFKFHSRPSA